MIFRKIKTRRLFRGTIDSHFDYVLKSRKNSSAFIISYYKTVTKIWYKFRRFKVSFPKNLNDYKR